MIHPKFQKSIEHMLSDFSLQHQFFGEFALNIDFKEDERIPTAGVNVTSSGFNCYYNNEFLASLTQTDVNYLLIHEIEHLLLDHQTRTRSGGYEHQLSNIAQDMIINHIIDNESPTKFATKPEGGQTLPKEYKGNLFFEELYVFLEQEKEKYDQWKHDQGQCQEGQEGQDGQGNPSDQDGQGNPSDQDGQGGGKELKQSGGKGKCPVSKQLKEVFDSMEQGKSCTLDVHMKDEVSKDLKDSMVKEIVQGLRNRGLVTANIESMLEKLKHTRRDYIKDIVRAVSELKSYGKQRTYMKNRRNRFGAKGKTSIGVGLNVILDVSGSMYGYFEKALNTIFKDGIVCNIVQADTEVKSHIETTTKRQIQKMGLTGGGGTELQPAINYVTAHKKISRMPTVILTDGYTDSLDVTELVKGLVLTVDKHVPIKRGEIKQIVIED